MLVICFLLTVVFPNKGRPSIVAVRIRRRVVRIHRARRTIRVVRIDAETESRFSKPVFQPCSWRIQRSLSQCRTCPLHMDFIFKCGVGLRKDRPIIHLSAEFTVRCACSALRRLAACCTLTGELGQTLHCSGTQTTQRRTQTTSEAHKTCRSHRSGNGEPLLRERSCRC